MSRDSRVAVLIDIHSSSSVASPSPSSYPSSSSVTLPFSLSPSSSSSSSSSPSASTFSKKPRDPSTIAQANQLAHAPTYEPLPAQSQQPVASSLLFVHASDDAIPSSAATSHSSLHLSGKKRQRTAEVEELLVQLRMETNADDAHTPSRTYWSSSAVMPAHDSPSTSAQMSQSPADEPSTSNSNSSMISNIVAATQIQVHERLDIQLRSLVPSENSFSGLVAQPSSSSGKSSALQEPSCPPLVSTFVLEHLSRVHLPSLCSEFPLAGVNSELLSLIALCQFPLSELPTHGLVPDLTFQLMLKQLRCESDSHLHLLFQTHLASFRPPLAASSSSSSLLHSANSSSSSSSISLSITPAFKQFYLQCFQLIRQLSMPPHAKFIPLSIASHYLFLLLLPRSPSHMYPFRAFLQQRMQSSSSSGEQMRMSKDQWSCCLEWITSIDAHTLDGYEKEGSWPILMDDFVQWIWSQQGQSKQQHNSTNLNQHALNSHSTIHSTFLPSSDAEMGSINISVLQSSAVAKREESSSTPTTNDIGSFNPMLLSRSASRLGLSSPLWRMHPDLASRVLPLDDDQLSTDECLEAQNHSPEPSDAALDPFQLHLMFSSSQFGSDTPGDTRMAE